MHSTYFFNLFPGSCFQESAVQRTTRQAIRTGTHDSRQKLRERAAVYDRPAEKASGKGRRTAAR